MTVVYRAGMQLLKVRFLMLLSLACAVATSWWGWGLFETFGSRPADGGELASLPTRISVGGLVASLGIVFAAGMWLYGRVYVARLEVEEATGLLRVYTPRFVGCRTEVVPVSEVVKVAEHDGRSDFVITPSVNAPWASLRLPGRWLPRVLDLQGEWVTEDPEAIFRGHSKRGTT